jgi:hypothetical protein
MYGNISIPDCDHKFLPFLKSSPNRLKFLYSGFFDIGNSNLKESFKFRNSSNFCQKLTELVQTPSEVIYLCLMVLPKISLFNSIKLLIYNVSTFIGPPISSATLLITIIAFSFNNGILQR